MQFSPIIGGLKEARKKDIVNSGREVDKSFPVQLVQPRHLQQSQQLKNLQDHQGSQEQPENEQQLRKYHFLLSNPTQNNF